MKISHSFVAAFVIVLGLATFGTVLAGTLGEPTIFVDNYNNVTAYPVGASGNVAPLAITPDMIYPTGIARDSSGRIYVTNPSTNTVAIYLPDATGNVPPVAIVGGSKTRLGNPSAIALDRNGNIYVLNSATAAITVYASFGVFDTGSGPTPPLNQAPMAVIAGPKTKLKQPIAIAVDGSGDIYVANQAGGPVVPSQRIRQGTITVYPAGSNGNVAPTTIIKGSATGLIEPVSIALDANHNIYVANGFLYVSRTFINEPSIVVYPAGSAGDAQPSAVIGGTNTGLAYPSGLALDSSGNIYATGFTSMGIPTINVYPAMSNGNVSPTTIISGADTGLSYVSAMTLDPDGNIYALNGAKVTTFSAGSSGDAAPINTFTSAFTGIDGSSGIALDSAGKIYVANSYGGPDFPNGSLSIFAPGSYATTAPASVIMGDNTGLNYPQKLAVDAGGNISALNIDGTITEYPAGSTGNVTPSETINLSDNIDAVGIARGADGALYVANQGGVQCNNNGHCHQTSLGSINVYSANANGNAKASAVITGYATGIASPSAITVSKRGNIFVANEGPVDCSFGCCPVGDGSITVYAPVSVANAKPIATIQGALTQLEIPEGIAVDSNENIYVVDGGSSVNGGRGGKVGRAGSWGEGCALEQGTTASIAGGDFAGKNPDIFIVPGVFDTGIPISISILEFKAGSNGNTPPSAIIRGPFTALGGSAIAIGPSGP